MVRAWLMCSPVVNRSAPCNRDPPVDVSFNELHKVGILTQYIPTVDNDKLINKLCEERKYNFRDEVVISKEKMSDYDEKVKKFFEEHMHTGEQVRYILDGSGYFDVRDRDDKWMRIAVEPGDAVTLPAGIFYRFTPDHRDYMHILRLFKDQQGSVVYYRSEMAKVMSVREHYLKEYVENA